MIEFHLKQIIDDYNRKHLHNRLTITGLSRDTGISRHSLQKLCGGKYKRSNGISFDTLNRLINFFGLPVDKFITYQPDGMSIKLFDSVDYDPAKSVINTKTRSLIKTSVHCQVHFNNQKSNVDLIISVKHFPVKDIFIVMFGILGDAFPRFVNLFKNDLSNDTKEYIFARVIAHSGLLNHDVINRADKIIIMPSFNFKTWISPVHGLNSDDILRPKNVIKNDSDNSIIYDKTTNDFND